MVAGVPCVRAYVRTCVRACVYLFVLVCMDVYVQLRAQVIKVVIDFPAVGKDVFTAEKMRTSTDRSLVEVSTRHCKKAGPDNAHQLKLMFYKGVRLRVPCAGSHASIYCRSQTKPVSDHSQAIGTVGHWAMGSMGYGPRAVVGHRMMQEDTFRDGLQPRYMDCASALGPRSVCITHHGHGLSHVDLRNLYRLLLSVGLRFCFVIRDCCTD